VLAHAEIIKSTNSDSVPKYLRGFLGAVEADAGAAPTGAASSSAFSPHQNKWTNAKFNIKTQSSVSGNQKYIITYIEKIVRYTKSTYRWVCKLVN
jgi:hypothetical protein